MRSVVLYIYILICEERVRKASEGKRERRFG